ncbi:hypothetical protein H6P81_017699 [Aristolochia fimbriata]|uniref:Uncharacterized protein n=1 Tax=Aristolochia fimbriata TaxID=158543 RepID=A0AAV7DZ10_ARIFI|nr:hypothetical protein H6P81_017699 [Aristolochia fimbriata]
MKKGYEATKQWIYLGRKHQPTHFLELLQKCTSSQGFRGVGEFDSEQVQSIVSEEPSNCWSLPLVTLKNLDIKVLINMRNVAHNVWHGVELHYRWFDYDLHKCRLQKQNAKEVIETLADISKKRVGAHDSSTIEVIEANVREAAYLIAETEKMLEIIAQDKFSGLLLSQWQISINGSQASRTMLGIKFRNSSWKLVYLVWK